MSEVTLKDTLGNSAFAPPSSAIPIASQPQRVTSVDLVRGIVMILMALDHTRDFFSKLRFQPEDLSRATPFLFFTRWITHFCAPTFFLLAGVGVALSMSRGKTKGQMSRFLWTRGLWLIFLEVTITHFGWMFSWNFPQFLLVIWALGLSMIVLAALIYLPKKVILAISLATIALHNLLDGVNPQTLGALAPVWHILHAPGPLSLNPVIFVGYPLIPWFAVMSLGFVLGDVFTWDEARRRKFLLRAGGAAIVAFIVLRYFNIYGDANPWSVQKTFAMTLASFGNAIKYPPSLIYLLMTLGPTLVALALLEHARGALSKVITVYGRVPMFYYVLHLFLIHTLAYAFAMVQGGDASFLSLDVQSFPEWYGTNLAGVYLAWFIVVALLYFPCRKFARLKATRRDWWLSYL
ncbi:MAG TPA: heparan-alpha-glucosaminide N-acetyltransferase domain-containing protein [Gemmatimonadaceae bacterium]